MTQLQSTQMTEARVREISRDEIHKLTDARVNELIDLRLSKGK